MEGRSIGEGLVALAGRWKVKSLDVLDMRLNTYQERETAKWMAKDKLDKVDQMNDRVDTLRTLMERAREQNIFDVAGLKTMILSLFEDMAGTRKPCVVLSSVHRSKGLEWNRVFLLGRDEFMPSRMARSEWAMEQGINLIYVAVTRAKRELVEVTGVLAATKQKVVPVEQPVAA